MHICLFVTNLNTAVLHVVVAVLRDPFGHEALAMVLPDSLSRHFERSNRTKRTVVGAYACFERGRDPRWVYIPLFSIGAPVITPHAARVPVTPLALGVSTADGLLRRSTHQERVFRCFKCLLQHRRRSRWSARSRLLHVGFA